MSAIVRAGPQPAAGLDVPRLTFNRIILILLELELIYSAPAPSRGSNHYDHSEASGTMKWLNVITLLLAIIGGVNWGLVALGGYNADLVANIFGGSDTGAARLVYGLVGLSALWQLMPFFRSLRVGEVDAEADRHHHVSARH